MVILSNSPPVDRFFHPKTEIWVMVHVLVIDDDVYMRDILVIALEDTNFSVEEAADGFEGLASQRARPADLVIADMGLPDCDGLDVIRALRREYPHTAIIAISGGGRVAEQELFPQVRALGVVRTMTKPFHLEEMLNTIAEAVA